MSAANQTNELGTRNRQLTWWSANIVLTMLAMQLLLPTNAFAWGETGHRVVCQIAYDSLLPAARHELDRLLSRDPDFDNFAESCLFADSPERIRWQDHFLNVPRSTLAITTFDCPLAETCVLPAIRSDFLVLLDPESTDADKWLALKLLGHWVGDVHQPMHVSFQDDRGANSNHVKSELFSDPEYANLHAAWDYLIISHQLGDDFEQIARALGSSISEDQRNAWRYDSPIEWANESYQITISPAVGYCQQRQGACWYSSNNMMLDEEEDWRTMSIDREYLRQHAPVVRQRLQQAGIRLAHLINKSLTTEEKNEQD